MIFFCFVSKTVWLIVFVFRNSGQTKPKDIIYDDQFNGSSVCETNPELLGNMTASSSQQHMPLYGNQSVVQRHIHLYKDVLDVTDMSRNVEVPGETLKAFDKRTC